MTVIKTNSSSQRVTGLLNQYGYKIDSHTWILKISDRVRQLLINEILSVDKDQSMLVLHSADNMQGYTIDYCIKYPDIGVHIFGV